MLHQFVAIILDSSVNCFAFKMNQYGRKENLLRSSSLWLIPKNYVLSVCLSLFSTNKVFQFNVAKTTHNQ